MTMTDPIADLLTRIRNGIQVGKRFVDVPSSKIKSEILLVLKDEGYIGEIEAVEGPSGFPQLRLQLRYDEDDQSAIQEITRISKPGRRVYSDCQTIPSVRKGLGVVILTTSKGVMSGKKASEFGVGGEVLCTVF
jgi:small subunit ribosomal protein S8